MRLTDTAIKRAKPFAKTVRLFDGGGLYLEVAPSGGKWWRLKYRFGGKEKRVSLGVYPVVSLAEARNRRTSLRAMLGEGVDPMEHVKSERAERQLEQERQIAATRFMLDNDGALTFRFGNRRVALSPAETVELAAFLDATRHLIGRVTACR